MSQQTTKSTGIGFVGLLTIAFIVLKLTNYIDWPWMWVLSPMLISAIIGAVVLIVALILFVIADKVWK